MDQFNVFGIFIMVATLVVLVGILYFLIRWYIKKRNEKSKNDR